MTRANIVQLHFVPAKPMTLKGLRDNFDLASLYSTGKVAADLANAYSRRKPANPVKVYGRQH
ncbi:VirB8/TrbF family protein [Rhizobium beringeri]